YIYNFCNSNTTAADGRLYAVDIVPDSQIMLFSRTSSTPLWIYDTEDSSVIEDIGISADGEYIVAIRPNKIYFFDKDSSTPLWTKSINSNNGPVISISGDGEYIAYSTTFQSGGSYYPYIELLDNSGDSVWKAGGSSGNYPGRVFDIEISADNGYVLAGTASGSGTPWGNELHLFGIGSATQLWTWNAANSCHDVDISSNGRLVATCSSSSSSIWDLNAWSVSSSTPTWSTSSIDFDSVSISGDGQHISAGSQSGYVYYYNYSSSSYVWNHNLAEDEVSNCKPIKSVDISFDGKYISAVNTCGSSYNGRVIVGFYDTFQASLLDSYRKTDDEAGKGFVSSSASGRYVAVGTSKPELFGILLFQNGNVDNLSVYPFYPNSGIESSSPVLRWFAGSDDRSNLTFDVYLSTNSNPTTLVANDISTLSYTPTGLSKNTKYYWKVIATDPSGSKTSSVMNFTVPMTPEWSYDVDNVVYSVETSADGEYIVAGSGNNKVYLFDKDSSTPLWSYTTGHDVYTVAISADGEYIVAGSNDNKVYLFDKDSSTPLWTYSVGDDVSSVSISADGEYITAGSVDNKVYLFDKDSSTPLWSYTTGDGVKTVDISADGEYIVAGSEDNKGYLFDKDSNTPLWSYTTGHLVRSVSISADGEYIVMGSVDSKVYLFDKDSNTPLWNYDVGTDVWSVSISADGEDIVAGDGDGNVYLFDKDSSTPQWSYDIGSYASVAISRDGEHIVVGSNSNEIYLFDKGSSTPLWSYETGNNVRSVSISADGKYISGGSEDANAYLFKNSLTDRPSVIPYGPRSGSEAEIPVLRWFAGSDDISNLTFDVYLSTYSNPVIKVKDDTTSLTFSPVALENNKKYYWKVVATDPSGSTTSQIMNFTYTGSTYPYVNITSVNPNPAFFGTGQYMREITLSSSTPVAGYQFNLTLTTSNFNYSRAQSDGDDLRFYDKSSNELSYYIETWNSTGTSTVWVRAVSSGTSSVYMYYGDAFAPAKSSYTDTFDRYIDTIRIVGNNSDASTYHTFIDSDSDIRLVNDIVDDLEVTFDVHLYGDYWRSSGSYESVVIRVYKSESSWSGVGKYWKGSDDGYCNWVRPGQKDSSTSMTLPADLNGKLESYTLLGFFSTNDYDVNQKRCGSTNPKWGLEYLVDTYTRKYASSAPTATLGSEISFISNVVFSGSLTGYDGSDISILWTSSIDGNLGSQYNLSLGLSDLSGGSHTINFTVSDDNDLWSRQDSLTLTVHHLPTASITSVSSHIIQKGTSVTLTGSGTDSDGNITAYRWRSSIDGFLNSSVNLSISTLSTGNHTIYFMVLDNTGLWSSEASSWVRVNDPPALSNYSLSATVVVRTNSIAVGLNSTDTEDAENKHTILVQYRGTTGGWQKSYISTLWYDSSDSRWETNFTSSSTAVLGYYDLRIMVNDTDGGSTGWNSYSDVILVEMNPGWSNTTGDEKILTIATSADGEYIVAGSNNPTTSGSGKIHLFSKDSSTPLWSFDEVYNRVDSVAISADGEYIVASGPNNKIYLFDKDSSTPLWYYTASDDVDVVSISADGEYIVAGSDDDKVYLFDKDSNSVLWSYETDSNILSVAVSANGEHIVAGSQDDKVYLFGKDSSTPLWSYDAGTDVRLIAVSADGKYVAASWHHTVAVFDSDSSSPLWTKDTGDTVLSVSISADGEYLVAGGSSNNKNVYLFDKDSSTPLWTYEPGGDVLSVDISEDGEYIVAGSGDNKVYLFDKDSSTPLWNYTADEDVATVSISADGSYIAIGTSDGEVHSFKNSLPSRPSLITYNPRSGSTIENPVLRWFTGSDDRSNLTFDVYLDTNSSPSTLVADDISVLSYTTSGLTKDTKYYWKVVATDPSGSKTSTVMNFTYIEVYGEWKFNDGSGTNAYDSSGYGNNGTLTNGPSWIDGVNSTAINFDGDNDYVDIGSTNKYRGDALTLSAWVRFDDLDATYYIVSNYDGSTFENGDLMFGYDNGDDKLIFMMGQGSNVGLSYRSNSTGLIEPDKWYFLVGTYDESRAVHDKVRFYINGESIDFARSSGSHGDGDGSGALVLSNDVNLRIGAGYVSTSYLPGIIDEVSILKRSMNSTEISSLYSGFETPISPDWSYTTGGDVRTVAVSEDGEYFVIGSYDDKVYLFDKDSNTPLWSYETGGDVYSVAISADGEYIAVGDSESWIYIFDKDSSSELWKYQAGGSIIGIDISADGEYIVAGAGDYVYLFDKDSSTFLWSYQTGNNVFSVAISADGEYITAGSYDKKVYLFDKDSSTPLWTYETDDYVVSVDISADGHYLTAGSDDDKVYIFKIGSNTPLWKYETGNNLHTVSISADGEYIAAGSEDDKVYLFDKDSSTPLWTYSIDDTAKSVSISEDGKYLLVGSYDGKIYLFDKTSSTPLWNYAIGGGDNSAVASVSLSSDGKNIIVGSHNQKTYSFKNILASRPSLIPYGPVAGGEVESNPILRWFAASDDISNLTFDVYFDTNTNPTTLVANDISTLSFAPSNAAKGFKYYWKVIATDPSGNKTSSIMNFTIPITPEWNAGIGGPSYSADTSASGEYVVTGGGAYVIVKDFEGNQLWSYETGDTVHAVVISADGQYVAAGSDDNKLYLFDIDSSTPLWSYETSYNLKSVAISSDGKYITAVNDKVYLFEKSSSTPLWTYDTTGGSSVDISADGNYIVVGTYVSSSSGKLHLFNKQSNTPIWTYSTYAFNTENSVAISADGKYVAGVTGSGVYEFSLFDVNRDSSTPLWTKTLSNQPNGRLDISANGEYICVGTEGSTSSYRKVHLFDKDSSTAIWSHTISASIYSLRISSDGESIVAARGSNGSDYGGLVLYNKGSSIPVWEYGMPYSNAGQFSSAAISSDGKYIFGAHQTGSTGNQLYLFEDLRVTRPSLILYGPQSDSNAENPVLRWYGGSDDSSNLTYDVYLDTNSSPTIYSPFPDIETLGQNAAESVLQISTELSLLYKYKSLEVVLISPVTTYSPFAEIATVSMPELVI
ncbi:DUF2341 domain-containing protein, partial [Marine Group III euryarchaeote]|nr:DUF2341 domain-containing protein [Marine Group III euryarchaeote]